METRFQATARLSFVSKQLMPAIECQGAKELQKHFHGGFCGHSSLWHPLEVCLKASTDIHYDLNHVRKAPNHP